MYVVVVVRLCMYACASVQLCALMYNPGSLHIYVYSYLITYVCLYI